MLGEPEFSLQSMCKPENIYALACILREAVLKAFAETAVLCSSRLQLFTVYLLVTWNWKYVSWVATIIFSAGVVRGLARIGGSAQGLLSWLCAQGIIWCSKPGLWHAEHVLPALWAVSPALGINFVLISVQRRRTLKGEDLSVVFVYRRKCFVNCKTDSKYFTLKLRLFSCQLAYHSTISSTMLAITIKLKTRNKKVDKL